MKHFCAAISYFALITANFSWAGTFDLQCDYLLKERFSRTRTVERTVEIITPAPTRVVRSSNLQQDSAEIRQRQEAVKKALDEQANAEKDIASKFRESQVKTSAVETDIKKVNKVLEGLTVKIEELQSALSKQEEEKRKLQEKNHTLGMNIVLKEIELNVRLETNSFTVDENKKLQEDLECLRAEKLRAEGELKALGVSTESIKEKLKKTQDEKISSAKKLKILEDSLASLSTELADRAEKLKSANKLVASLIEKLHSAENEAKNMIEKIMGSYSDIGTSVLGWSPCSVSLEDIHTGASLDVFLAKMQEDLVRGFSRVQEEAKVLVQEKEDALKKNSAEQKLEMEKQEALFRQQAEEKSAQIASLRSQINSLEADMLKLETNRNDLKDQLEEKTRALSKMREDKETLERELADLKAKHVTVLAELKNLEIKIKAANQEKDLAQESSAALNKLLEAAQNAAIQDHQSLQAQIKELKKSLTIAKEQAETEKRTLNSSYESQAAAVAAEHEAALKHLNETVEEKRQALVALEKKFDLTGAATNAKNEDYESRLKQAQKDLAEARQDAYKASEQMQEQHRLALEQAKQKHQDELAQLVAQSNIKEKALQAELNATRAQATQKVEALTQALAAETATAEAAQVSLKASYESQAAAVAAEHEAALGALSQTVQAKELGLKELEESLVAITGAAEAQRVEHESRLKQAQKDLEEARQAASKACERMQEQHRQTVEQAAKEHQSELAQLVVQSNKKEQALQTELNATRAQATQEIEALTQALATEKATAEAAQVSLRGSYESQAAAVAAEHEAALAALSQTVQEKEHALTELEKALEVTIGAADAQKVDYEARLKQAREDLKHATQERVTLEHNYAQQVKDLRAQNEKQVLDLEGRTAKLAQKLESTQAMLTQANSKAQADAEAAQLAMTELMTQLQAAHLAAEARVVALQAQHHAVLETQAEDHAQILKALQGDLGKKAALLAEKLEELEKNAAEMEKLKAEILNDGEIIADHLDTIEAFESELASLTVKNSQLSNDKFDLETERSRLLSNKTGMEINIAGLEDDIERLSLQISSSNEKVQKLKSQLKQQAAENASQTEALQEKLSEETEKSRKLSAQLEQVQESLKTKEDELSSVFERLRILEEKLASTSDELTENIDQKQKVQQKLQDAVESLTLAQDKLGQLEAENASLTRMIGSLEDSERSLRVKNREENQKFYDEKEKLEETLRKTQREALDLKNQIENAQKNMESILESSQAGVPDSLGEKISILQKLIRTLKQSDERSKEKIVEREEQIKALIDQQTKLNETLCSLKEADRKKTETLKETENSLVQEQVTVSNLARQVRDTEGKIEKYEDNQGALLKQLVEKEERIEALEEEKEVLKRSKESLDFEIKELQKELSDQKASAQGLDEKVRDLTRTVAASSRKLRSADADYEDVRTILSEHDREMQKQRKKTGELEGQCDKLKSELRSKQSELAAADEKAKAQLQEFADHVKPQLEELNQTIAEHQASLEEGQREKANIQARLEEKEKALEAERAQHESLKAQYESVFGKKNEASFEVKRLRDNLSNLQKENEGLKKSLSAIERQKSILEARDRAEQDTPKSMARNLAQKKHEAEQLSKQKTVIDSISKVLRDQNIDKAFSPSSGVDSRGAAGGSSPKTSRANGSGQIYRTPESKRVAPPHEPEISKSPGLALAASQTPFAKNLFAQLQQLGPIGEKNQAQVIQVLMASLKEAGYGLELASSGLVPGSMDSGIGSGILSPRKMSLSGKKTPLSSTHNVLGRDLASGRRGTSALGKVPQPNFGGAENESKKSIFG